MKVIVDFQGQQRTIELADEPFAQVLDAFAAQYGATYNWRPTLEGRDAKNVPMPVPNPETKLDFWLRVQRAWMIETVLELQQAELKARKEFEYQQEAQELEFQL